MSLKRRLVTTLPPSAKRLLALPYDAYQTRKANAAFGRREVTDRTPDPTAPSHIVCVVVDALRADHVSPALTPYLDSLAHTDAITPGAWTFPAVSSMISGRYPHEHGAMKRTDEVDDSPGITLPPRMDESIETLTDVLAGAGYETYGGFGHDTPFVALSGYFQNHALSHKINSNADDVLGRYLEWVSGRDRTFAFIHLADPHIPVDPPEEYWRAHDVDRSIDGIENWRYRTDVSCDDDCRRYRDNRRRLYRAAVAYVDDALERFHARLADVVDDPLLIVTADHGEALWEHVERDVDLFDGTGTVDHGGAPYEALARVPLATTADWDLDGPVSLVDVAPTLYDAIGVDGPRTSGYSLRDGVPDDRTPIVEGSLSGYEKKAIYGGRYKLIVSKGDDVELGVTVPDDEPVDLPDDRREALRAALPPWPDGADEATDVSGVVEDRLAQLGYK